MSTDGDCLMFKGGSFHSMICQICATWIDMDNKEISPDTVLKNHGGANGKNFAEIINEGQDEDEVNIIRHSPYYVPSNLPSDLANKDNSFSVLSLNAQSLFAKFNGLQAILDLYSSQRIRFPVICIQETWITDESKLPIVSLEGYECFYVKPTSSSHGGLITYVDNEFDVSVTKKKWQFDCVGRLIFRTDT